MQDFIRIGVAYPAEQAWIGERALQSMALPAQRRAEVVHSAFQNLQTTALEGRQGTLPAHRVQGGPSLRSRLRQKQRPIGEVERRLAQPSRNLRAALLPPQTSRNHEVKNEEQLPIEIDDDALAETPQAGDGAPVHSR